jgi:hypothetical protein
MATGANHRPCVGYPSFERLLVHIATLADDSGEPRSISYRRVGSYFRGCSPRARG